METKEGVSSRRGNKSGKKRLNGTESEAITSLLVFNRIEQNSE